MNIRPRRLQTGAFDPAQVSWRRSPTEESPRDGVADTVHPARSRGSRAPIAVQCAPFRAMGRGGWGSLDLGRQASILPRLLDPRAGMDGLPPAGGRLTSLVTRERTGGSAPEKCAWSGPPASSWAS